VPHSAKRPSLDFKILAQVSESRARAGTFQTLHGEIQTPLFMPVGTQASVRNVHPESLLDSGSQILLANTYHLFLRPGKEVFDRLGSIHTFMKWPRSVLTDSGGYQVFSLSQDRKINEEGVIFSSYVDGTKLLLSPETSISMQRSIGSDIMMAMDVCIPSTSEFD
jgi:queuine tRNA-ribosyltransferase